MKKLALITCTVDNLAQAKIILNQLRAVGFSSNNLSVLFPKREDTQKLVKEKPAEQPKGVTVGKNTEDQVGGVLEWLTGIGSLAIPGVGPFIAAGPIVAALGDATNGATGNSLMNLFIELGIPENKAILYEQKITAGYMLILVHTKAIDGKHRKRTQEIFRNANTDDFSQVMAA